MSDDNDERVVDALVAKRTSELATTPMRSVGYAEGHLAGFSACKLEALRWCLEMLMADDNADWREACEACREAIESKVMP